MFTNSINYEVHLSLSLLKYQTVHLNLQVNLKDEPPALVGASFRDQLLSANLLHAVVAEGLVV